MIGECYASCSERSTREYSPADVVNATSTQSSSADSFPSSNLTDLRSFLAISTIFPNQSASSPDSSKLEPTSAPTFSINDSCLSQASHCEGEITWYSDEGLGACGMLINQAVDMYLALPWEFFDGAEINGNPNDNPLCGKAVTIFNPAALLTANATIQDRCPGCDGRHIDLTIPLWNAVAGLPQATGVVSDVQWWFSS